MSASISGMAWRSPPGSASTMCRSALTASPPGAASRRWPPRPKPVPWAPPAAAFACGVSTCPTAAPWTTRTTSTSWIGLPHCVIRPKGGFATIQRRPSRWSATGTSPRPTRTSGAPNFSSAPRTSPSRNVKRSTPSSTTQFSDVVRPFTPGPDVYTYWDYTQLRFPKRQGMRIDFILASPTLAARVTDAQIVREERKGKAPSDHAPVLIDVKRG